ncbi:MAG: hypothetical protein WBH74_03635 [Methanothermobacter thermautotrophicus]
MGILVGDLSTAFSPDMGHYDAGSDKVIALHDLRHNAFSGFYWLLIHLDGFVRIEGKPPSVGVAL